MTIVIDDSHCWHKYEAETVLRDIDSNKILGLSQFILNIMMIMYRRQSQIFVFLLLLCVFVYMSLHRVNILEINSRSWLVEIIINICF